MMIRSIICLTLITLFVSCENEEDGDCTYRDEVIETNKTIKIDSVDFGDSRLPKLELRTGNNSYIVLKNGLDCDHIIDEESWRDVYIPITGDNVEYCIDDANVPTIYINEGGAWFPSSVSVLRDGCLKVERVLIGFNVEISGTYFSNRGQVEELYEFKGTVK